MKKMTKPPIDDHLIEFKLPEYDSFKMPNGMEVIVIEKPDLPKIYLRLGLRFGTRNETPEKAGLAQLLAQTIKKGANGLSATEIADRLDQMGAELDSGVSEDFFYVFGEFLKDLAPAGIELMSDIVMRPDFPPEEVEKERQRLIANLQNENSSAAFLGHRRFEKQLYLPHPYGIYKTETSLQSLDRQELLKTHAAFFNPQRAILIIAGDVSTADAKNWAERFWGKWPTAESTTREVFPSVPKAQPRLQLVNRPQSEQVTLLLGNLLFARNHPDYETMLVLNHILGGGGSSRLFMVLREEKGYTYGAYSSVQAMEKTSHWLASAQVRPSVVADALRTFIDEFEKIRSLPVTDAELRNARRYLIGSFPLKNETPSSIASLLLRQRMYNLPGNYWDSYLEKIAAVTAEDIQTAAQRYVLPEELLTVVVGDADQLLPQLEPLGNVEIFDMSDAPMNRNERNR